MSRLSLGVAVVGALLLTACGEGTGPGDSNTRVDSLTALPRALSAVEQEGVQANNGFALSLLRTTVTRISGDSGNAKNVLLSPISVSFALGLTMNGAANTTLAEMQQTLGWGSRSRTEINTAYKDLAALLPSLDSSTTIRIANGVWVLSPMRADTGFARDAQTYFGAPVHALATPRLMYDSVNAWGKRQTDGMVPKVLEDAPPPDLAMLLVNAVLFSGTWRDRFDPAKTTPRTFTPTSGAAFSHPMMQRTGNFLAFGNGRVSAVELLYGNGAYSMVLIAPQNEPATQYAARLDTAEYGSILRGLRAVDDRSEVILPRFTVRGTLELKAMLETMGMPRAFTSLAEFPRLIGGERAQLEFVRHGVALEVNERGSRAAAVTVVGATVVSMPPVFAFTRPFVFFIRERLSGTILFAGVVNDPRQ